jgi:predicted porin
MKKQLSSVLAAVASLSATAAMAQVTVYGIVDVGVERVSNVNAAGDSAVKMPSLTGSFPSRLGFKGSEDLGNGVQAVFALETGFGPDTGTLGQGNRLFGRQAWVGLKGSYGTLMLGRQPNMTFYSMLKADVLGPHIFSINSLDGYLPNSRSDNAIGYLGTFSGVTLGATYSLGRDASSAGGPGATGCAGEVAGNSKACRQVTGLLSYDSKSFGVLGAYDILYGGPGANNGMTSSDYSDRRLSLNGYVYVGTVKVAGGLIDRRTRMLVETGTELHYLGASYGFAPQWVLDAQVSRLAVDDTPRKSTLSVARVSYLLSKRTAVHGSVGHMKNAGGAAVAVDAGGTVGPGLNQSGVMLGVRHTF